MRSFFAARTSFRNSWTSAAAGVAGFAFFLSSLPPFFLSLSLPFFAASPPSPASPSRSAWWYSAFASTAHSTSSTAGWSSFASSASRTISSCRSLPRGVASFVAIRTPPSFSRRLLFLDAFSSFSRSARTSFSSCSSLFLAIISSFFVGFLALGAFLPPLFFAAMASALASAACSATRSFSFSHMTRGSKAVSGARLRSTTGMRDFVSFFVSRRLIRVQTVSCGYDCQYTSMVRAGTSGFASPGSSAAGAAPAAAGAFFAGGAGALRASTEPKPPPRTSRVL